MSKLIYDPNNPLSDEELDKIAEEDFDKFLEYLDSKTAYLKQFSKPLSAYHLKRFASQAKMDAGEGALTTEEIKKLQKQGEENDAKSFDEEKHKKKFLAYCLFKQLAKETLDNVDNIHAQECGLYSDKYKVAGRVDCIAEYNGKLSIIDFKTSTKERSDEWNENYYIQASAYAEMYEERTGKPIDQIVILVVTEDGVVQEFIKEKHDYLPMLGEVIGEFNGSRT